MFEFTFMIFQALIIGLNTPTFAEWIENWILVFRAPELVFSAVWNWPRHVLSYYGFLIYAFSYSWEFIFPPKKSLYILIFSWSHWIECFAPFSPLNRDTIQLIKCPDNRAHSNKHFFATKAKKWEDFFAIGGSFYHGHSVKTGLDVAFLGIQEITFISNNLALRQVLSDNFFSC